MLRVLGIRAGPALLARRLAGRLAAWMDSAIGRDSEGHSATEKESKRQRERDAASEQVSARVGE